MTIDKEELPVHMRTWPKEAQDKYLANKKKAIASGECVCSPPKGWCKTHEAFGCGKHCPKTGCSCGSE